MIHTNHSRQIFAILNRAKLTRTERLCVLSYIANRVVTSTAVLEPFELEAVSGTLFSWEASGHLDAQLVEILAGVTV